MRFVVLIIALLGGWCLHAQLPPTLVSDINPGASSSRGMEKGALLKGKLIFPAQTDDSGEEVWISDGTTAGTRLLADLVPGEDGSEPHAFTQVGEFVFFAATTPRFGTELYRTDGTTRGTRLVADILPGEPSGLLPDPNRTFGYFQDTLLFAARSTIAETELWRSDGTLEGTYLLKDIELLANNTRGSLPRDFHTGDKLTYFTAESGVDNRQIWRTDGTEAGTVRVSNFRGARGITLESMAVNQDTAYFGALTRLTSYDLYKLGPEDDRPTLLFDFNGPGMDLVTNHGSDQRFAFLSDRFIFAADINGGGDVYVSDGTPAGTRIIENLPELGGAGYAPQNFVAVDDIVYYTDATPSNGVELWRTDGTQLGTYRVRDLIPGAESAIVPTSRLHGHDGQVYFAARGLDNNNLSTGTELYVSDGTSSGTRLVSNINASGGSSFPAHFVSNGGQLLFYADDGFLGQELYSLSTTRPLQASVVVITPVSCFGGNDGTATFNVTGGSSEADGTAGERTVSNLTVGEKVIFFRDDSGNAVRVVFTITGPTDFTVTSQTTGQRAREGGSITVSVDGATPPYRYAWSDGPSTDSLRTGLAFGEYTLTITDANGCTYVETFTVDNLTSVATFAQAGIKLYPTLTTGRLSIESAVGQPFTELQIFTAAGQPIHRQDFQPTEMLNLQLPIATMTPGMYVIRLRMDGGAYLASRFFYHN